MSRPDPRISEGFYKSISKLKETHEFEDFKVTIDGDIFSCHSFILASCSDFFRHLLNSDMKEKHEMKVDLKDISSQIFQLILDSLYTGCEFLTKENVLEVWSAVHQLQIHFLIEHCELFVKTKLSFDTLEIYKRQAEYLQSEKVCEYIFTFMLKNFGTLRKQEIFLRLNYSYLTKLLISDKLEVCSEDLVLYSIFDWVNNKHCITKNSGIVTISKASESTADSVNTKHCIESSKTIEEPKKENTSTKLITDSITEELQIKTIANEEKSNDRKKLLIPLLKATRYCLASETCIISLYKNKLIQNDIIVKEYLFEAFTFKFCYYVQGHWPTTAIHRESSNLEHVGICYHEGELSAFSFKQEKWFRIDTFKMISNTKLTVCKGKVYASSTGCGQNRIYVLQSNKWVSVTAVSHSIKILLGHEQYFYILGSNEKTISRFNPDKYSIETETFRHETENLEYALSFHNSIVIFSSVKNIGVEETAVHSWNTEANVWTKLDNLNFSSQNMTSFRGDRDTYILDSNGNLFKMTNSEIIEFTFVAKLWSVKYDVRGAVLFRETLYIFGDTPCDIDMLDKVEGVFSLGIIWGLTRKSSNLVHYLLYKYDLKYEQPRECQTRGSRAACDPLQGNLRPLSPLSAVKKLHKRKRRKVKIINVLMSHD